MNQWMLDFEVTQQDAAIEDIARIGVHSYTTGRDEDGVFTVANIHRVDCHTAEQTAADAPDVDLSFHLSGDPRLDVASDLSLAVLRLRQRQSDQKDNHHRCDQRECAECDYSLTP